MATKEKTKSTVIVLLAVLCGLLVLVTAWALFLRQPRETPAAMTPIPMEVTEPVAQHPETIDFPGFERLRLKADSETQTLRLTNPPANACYFQISIVMEDGTELWKSGLVEPGYYSEPATLTRPLAPGIYENATVLYQTFTMDGSMTPLNGGSINVLLDVQ